MAVSTVKLNGTTIMTVNNTTATSSDVKGGKYFYTADGMKTLGLGTTGASTIATGTFTGSNTYYQTFDIGNQCPTTNFAMMVWVNDGTEFAYDTTYKIVQLTLDVHSDFGSFIYKSTSSGTETYNLGRNMSVNVNNDGTITNATVIPATGLFTFLRNGSAGETNSYTTSTNTYIYKKSTGLSFYYNRQNASYKFMPITYNWKIIYYGANYANEHLEV